MYYLKTMTIETSFIFATLSVVFVFLAAREYFRQGGKLSISARVWLRIAFIFAAMAAVLEVIL
jgi:hypothetical protein